MKRLILGAMVAGACMHEDRADIPPFTFLRLIEHFSFVMARTKYETNG
jgi:hypothetical protein